MDRPVSFLKRSSQIDPWGKITGLQQLKQLARIVVADKRHSIVHTILRLQALLFLLCLIRHSLTLAAPHVT
jgi:hypothetical protein